MSGGTSEPVFESIYYDLAPDKNCFLKKKDAKFSMKGEEELSAALGQYVEQRIIYDFGFVSVSLNLSPEDLSGNEDIGERDGDVIAELGTTILASPDYQSSKKLLIMAMNRVNSQIGIFSRSLCLSDGLSHGSMLHYIQKARELGYGVLILRPNHNFYQLEIGGPKIPIKGSESPELHAMCVFENIVSQCTNLQSLALFGYGNGSLLCHDMYVKSLLSVDLNVVHAFVTVEASQVLADDDSADIKQELSNLAVNFELNAKFQKGVNLAYRIKKLGCVSISLGMPPIPTATAAETVIETETENKEKRQVLGDVDLNDVNVGASTLLALEPVFFYINQCYERFCAEEELSSSASSASSALGADVDNANDHDEVEAIDLVKSLTLSTTGGEIKIKNSEEGEERTAASTAPYNVNFANVYADLCGLSTTHRIVESAPLCQQTIETWAKVGNPQKDQKEKNMLPKDATGANRRVGKRGSIFELIFGKDDTSIKTNTNETSMSGSAADNNNNDYPTYGHEKQNGQNGQAKMTVKDFDLIKVVGKGAFGKVLLVRKKDGVCKGNIYAMKILKKSQVIAQEQVEHTLAERAILSEIRHPYIVYLRFSFQNPEKLYLLTDYYNGGTLYMHLNKDGRFDEYRAKFYAAEILSALMHLHSNDIIYRDLKLENIMMDHRGHLALIDFGLSKHQFDNTGATTFCGTPYYLAPELLKGVRYGYGVDFWSLGVVIFEMIRGKTPFQDKTKKNVYTRILKGKCEFNEKYFSDTSASMISRLLDTNPDKRLGSDEVMKGLEVQQHDFFNEIDFAELNEVKIDPPFQPSLSGPTDTKYVGKSFDRLDPNRESGVSKEVRAAAEKKAKNEGKKLENFSFQNFSYY